MANTGTDIGALTEALNDKMDRDIQNRAVGVQTVVETWHEGTEWYRVWSDGWIEQGGYSVPFINGTGVTINFRKPFSDLNYNVCGTPVREPLSNTSTSTQSLLLISRINESQVQLQTNAGANTPFTWRACGY